MMWKIIKCMICGYTHKGTNVMLPPIIIALIIISSTANVVQEFKLVILTEMGIFISTCVVWLASMLATSMEETVLFTPDVLKTLRGKACSLEDALDYIRVYPWDVVTIVEGIKDRCLNTSGNRYEAGRSSIIVRVYHIPKHCLAVLSVLNPALVGALVSRDPILTCLVFAVTCIIISFQVCMSEHSQDVVYKRIWLNRITNVLNNRPEVESPP